VFLPKYASRRGHVLSWLLFVPAVIAVLWMPSVTENPWPTLLWALYVVTATVIDFKYFRLRRSK
jgi:hypothetical protein